MRFADMPEKENGHHHHYQVQQVGDHQIKVASVLSLLGWRVLNEGGVPAEIGVVLAVLSVDQTHAYREDGDC